MRAFDVVLMSLAVTMALFIIAGGAACAYYAIRRHRAEVKWRARFERLQNLAGERGARQLERAVDRIKDQRPRT